MPLTTQHYVDSMLRFAEQYRAFDHGYLRRLVILWSELSEHGDRDLRPAYRIAAARIGEWLASDGANNASGSRQEGQGGTIG